MAEKRSRAQSEADARYEEKRKGKPRLPGDYLTDAENDLLCEMAEKHGNKKKAILMGLALLKEKTPY